MSDTTVLLQRESDTPVSLAVMAAILRERTEVMGREMRYSGVSAEQNQRHIEG